VADVIGAASLIVTEAALSELEARSAEPTKSSPKAARDEASASPAKAGE